MNSLPGVWPWAGPAREDRRRRRRRQQLVGSMVGELRVIGDYAVLLAGLPPEDPRRQEGEIILSEVTALHRFIAETVL